MKENHESNKKKKRKKKKKVRIHKEKEDYLMPHQREKSSSRSLHTMKKKELAEDAVCSKHTFLQM